MCKTSLTDEADQIAKLCISVFNHLIHRIRKQNMPQDAAWKALQFIKDHLFYSCTFYFENGQISERSNFNVAKMRFFLVKDELVVSYLIFSLPDMHY